MTETTTPEEAHRTSTSESGAWECCTSSCTIANASSCSTGLLTGARTDSHTHVVLHSGVPHVQQRFNWDCGLACVMMVLKALGVQKCSYQALRKLCPTTSIWTVDLAHLLQHYGVDVSFYTITIGINSDYASESFYADHIEDDERRVLRLFAEARATGVPIHHRSLSLAELQAHVMSGSCLVIALVDKRKLDPWLMAADLCLPTLCGMAPIGYTGHYVVIVGYDPLRREFLVRDPAHRNAIARVTASVFESARRSFGTDEDLLIIGTALRSSSTDSDCSTTECTIGAVDECCSSGGVPSDCSSTGGVRCCSTGLGTGMQYTHDAARVDTAAGSNQQLVQAI